MSEVPLHRAKVRRREKVFEGPEQRMADCLNHRLSCSRLSYCRESILPPYPRCWGDAPDRGWMERGSVRVSRAADCRQSGNGTPSESARPPVRAVRLTSYPSILGDI